MAKKKNDETFNSSELKKLWDWLLFKYDFKRDIIKSRILLRAANSKEKYRVLEDAELNGMSIEAAFKGLKTNSVSVIELLLKSNYVDGINPVAEYLDEIMKKRKPVGVIEKLCKCLVTDNDKLFKKYFTKWLASSVANVVNLYGCQNHTCLVFTSGQFIGKTTFFKWLCPPELRDYQYNGSLDLESKDTLWKLAEYWLINIEEQLKNLNKKDTNKVKEIMTLPEVKGRRPYGRLEACGYRIANFMAGTNDDDFLVDATGNRRFLCFRLLKIDDVAYQKIKIDDIWAEAYHYYREHPNDYFVTQDDIAELEENNKQFLHITQEYEYCNMHFVKPQLNDDYYLMPASIIRDYLRLHTGTQIIKDRAIGMALKQLGFEQVSYKFRNATIPIKVWKVALTNPNANSTLINYHANANNGYKP